MKILQPQYNLVQVVVNVSDELLIPNFDNVGLGLAGSNDRLNEYYDLSNFLKTKSYGQSPTNTTVTVKYFVGGGIESNVKKGDIKQITNRIR